MDVIRTLFPGWALKRAQAAARLAQIRAYDAAKTTPYRKPPRDGGQSADATLEAAGSSLRSWARYLDENHDIAIGILDTLVDRVIGDGLVFEPMVRNRSGDLHEATNDRLRALWREFWRFPEASRELAGCTVERLICRSVFRDGELLVNHLEGAGRIQHASAIPYTVELLEADFLPFDRFFRAAPGNTIHGVEKNTFGRPIAYHVFLEHPGNVGLGSSASLNPATKRVAAEQITHLKFMRRLRQTRGVPVLHGVITRLDDIKDAEESERIAMRVASAFCAAITRGEDFTGTGTDHIDASGDRTFEMRAGMIWDRLLPGENVAMIGPEGRPNTKITEFVSDQLKRIASGTGTSYSTIASDYDGSYSSQRQELVESEPGYARVRSYLLDQGFGEIYRRAILLAQRSGLVKIPQTVEPASVLDVEIRPGGGVPWIDPKREVEADIMLIEAGIVSRAHVQRRRGLDPRIMNAEIDQETPPAGAGGTGGANRPLAAVGGDD